MIFREMMEYINADPEKKRRSDVIYREAKVAVQIVKKQQAH